MSLAQLHFPWSRKGKASRAGLERDFSLPEALLVSIQEHPKGLLQWYFTLNHFLKDDSIIAKHLKGESKASICMFIKIKYRKNELCDLLNIN